LPSFPPDPNEDAADERPRALFGGGFWIALLFGLLCVIAGLAFSLFAPRWFAT